VRFQSGRNPVDGFIKRLEGQALAAGDKADPVGIFFN
jgi:hypothetical protein